MNRVAPLGPNKYLGVDEVKPWDYRVSVCIAHLDTIEPLKVCLDTLRAQTVWPYIIVVDTGSSFETLLELEKLRSENVEIHYVRGHAYRNSSEPVVVALDLAHALCRTEFLFHTHSDVFLRRDDFLEDLLRMTGPNNPVVGYKMSPRDWVTDEWEWMVGHTATMLHMPTMHRIGATWSFQRMHTQFGYPWTAAAGWPDTEVGFNRVLKEAGIKPCFIGADENFKRQTDGNIDHVRSHAGSKLYGPEHHALAEEWMGSAISEAKARLSLTIGKAQAASSDSPQSSES